MSSVAIQADITPTVGALLNLLKKKNFILNNKDPWWIELNNKGTKNKEIINVRDKISYL